ncbi:89b22f8b-72a3-4697-893f-ca3416aaa8ca [Sclerotinia trifoliorum]|uniref:89b22f8b-72a3-4697-893f-ca3416aaa8ca n=1 Tax=Sclerotinia trifoliorum TaxID=28548 RepID=A0A8H2ZUY6_9HELO|nr:89b22f8b-72a3-4697-893f-ca3416aaa8ca [Sclerotinia trifoliorum]
MRVLQNVYLQLILLAFASLVHSFRFTNNAFNPVLGQRFTITWVDSTGSVNLHLVPIQYYNESIPLASAESIGVATTGNSLPWAPDNSLHAGFYKISWVSSDNTQSVDSPTFTLGQFTSNSTASTSNANKTQPSSSDSSKTSSTTGTSNPTTTKGEAIPSSISTMNTPSETNQTNSLTNTIKIIIAISITLGLTLLIIITFMLIRHLRHLSSIPRTKRQLTTRELADDIDKDSWYEEHQLKSELSNDSKTDTSSYCELMKKKHISVNMEPVEMEAFFVRKEVNDGENHDRGDVKNMNEMELGFGLGLGNVDELVEPRELDAGTILGKGVIGRRFNVRDNVHIVGL